MYYKSQIMSLTVSVKYRESNDYYRITYLPNNLSYHLDVLQFVSLLTQLIQNGSLLQLHHDVLLYFDILLLLEWYNKVYSYPHHKKVDPRRCRGKHHYS